MCRLRVEEHITESLGILPLLWFCACPEPEPISDLCVQSRGFSLKSHCQWAVCISRDWFSDWWWIFGKCGSVVYDLVHLFM